MFNVDLHINGEKVTFDFDVPSSDPINSLAGKVADSLMEAKKCKIKYVTVVLESPYKKYNHSATFCTEDVTDKNVVKLSYPFWGVACGIDGARRKERIK